MVDLFVSTLAPSFMDILVYIFIESRMVIKIRLRTNNRFSIESKINIKQFGECN